MTYPHARVHVGQNDLAFGAALLHEPTAAAVVSALSVGDAHLHERTLHDGLAAVDPRRCNLRKKKG